MKYNYQRRLHRIGAAILAGVFITGFGLMGSTHATNSSGNNWTAQNAKRASQQMQLAQAGDAAFRINQLEDQVRRLNGQVEELNFQLLQMQEQLRRLQEDNDFRFQELENKKSGLITPENENTLANKEEPRLEKQQPSESKLESKDSGGVELKKIAKIKLPKTIDGVEIFDPENDSGQSGRTGKSGGSKQLGTITFDSAGNVVRTAVGKPLDLTFKANRLNKPSKPRKQKTGIDTETIATSGELYNLGFEYFQAGDYVNAEKKFSEYIKRFPKGEKSAKASFWLGESLFAQSRFKDAAKVFLETDKKWPNSRLAPQALLKLGLSLAGLQQRELACATYAKVFKRYPKMSNSVRKRVVVEQKSARCING